MVCIGFLLEIPPYLWLYIIHGLWGDFTPFFASFSKNSHITLPLKCYKNIYGLHIFSIENSFIPFFSDLKSFFHTFFKKIFRSVLLLSNMQLSKKIRVGRYLWRFSNFGRIHKLCADRRRRQGSQYPEWRKSLRLRKSLIIPQAFK